MSIYQEHDKDKTFHKAVKGEPTAPKRKHVRSAPSRRVPLPSRR